MSNQDPHVARLVDQVRTATKSGIPLDIRGGSSKAFYGNKSFGDPLDTRALAGITSHEPSELVVTVRAGTPLNELESVLSAHGQHLPFEPPRFGAPGRSAATVGGMVATGLAGPARAMSGSVRDHVLGATILTGRGEVLTFGGQVMKNVAGYDVSRLVAGSLGVLGVILEVSLKVLPTSPAERTIEFERDERQTLIWFNLHRAKPLSISATSWHDGRLRVRLRGADAAVESATRTLGGTVVDREMAAAWWNDVRDQNLGFFDPDHSDPDAGTRLWRLSVPATAPVLDLPGAGFIEWNGAQRWFRTDAHSSDVFAAAARVGGSATIYRSAQSREGVFAPLSEPLMRIHRDLKAAFDPAGILNPGRLYPGV